MNKWEAAKKQGPGFCSACHGVEEEAHHLSSRRFTRMQERLVSSFPMVPKTSRKYVPWEASGT